MSDLALYREWRPKTFTEVVGQKHIVAPLQQAVISGNIRHAYLFCGTHGTGKTSLAKIFAKAINCQKPENGNPCGECEICRAYENGSLMDVIEFDAASNNSVEDIRRMIDEVVYSPTKAKYKVYIIDEAHMLSMGALNALLKTLEEPPAHAIFILATTDPQRLLTTIISRCQRFNFRQISSEDMLAHLKKICVQKQIDATPEALQTIVHLSRGAMRDALSLLDQVASNAKQITREQLLAMVGVAQDDLIDALFCAMLKHDVEQVLLQINNLAISGISLQRFTLDFAEYLRNLLVIKTVANPASILPFTAEHIAHLGQLANLLEPNCLISLISALSELASELRHASDQRTVLEVAFLAMLTRIKPDTTLELPLNYHTVVREVIGSASNSASKDTNEGVPTPIKPVIPTTLPAELTESADVLEPVEQAEPTEPSAEPAEPAEPTEHTEPIAPAKQETATTTEIEEAQVNNLSDYALPEPPPVDEDLLLPPTHVAEDIATSAEPLETEEFTPLDKQADMFAQLLPESKPDAPASTAQTNSNADLYLSIEEKVELCKKVAKTGLMYMFLPLKCTAENLNYVDIKADDNIVAFQFKRELAPPYVLNNVDSFKQSMDKASLDMIVEQVKQHFNRRLQVDIQIVEAVQPGFNSQQEVHSILSDMGYGDITRLE